VADIVLKNATSQPQGHHVLATKDTKHTQEHKENLCDFVFFVAKDSVSFCGRLGVLATITGRIY